MTCYFDGASHCCELVMVLDGTFHKSYERKLLGNVLKNCQNSNEPTLLVLSLKSPISELRLKPDLKFMPPYAPYAFSSSQVKQSLTTSIPVYPKFVRFFSVHLRFETYGFNLCVYVHKLVNHVVKSSTIAYETSPKGPQLHHA